jgi:hypothetical protein
MKPRKTSWRFRYTPSQREFPHFIRTSLNTLFRPVGRSIVSSQAMPATAQRAISRSALKLSAEGPRFHRQDHKTARGSTLGYAQEGSIGAEHRDPLLRATSSLDHQVGS